MRFRPHDHEGGHLVVYVLDAAFGDLLRLAERPAHGGNRGVVLFDPSFPGGHSLLFLRAALGFRKRHPRLPAWAGFAAEKDGKVGIVRSHTVFAPLYFLGRTKSSTQPSCANAAAAGRTWRYGHRAGPI